MINLCVKKITKRVVFNSLSNKKSHDKIYFSLEARRFLIVLTNSFETPR